MLRSGLPFSRGAKMQQEITLMTHGGRRIGSGRKRLHSKGVSHKKRETFNKHTPLHINFRYKAHIHRPHAIHILKRAILNAAEKGLRITAFSLQTNHVHLIGEARNKSVLCLAMRSLTMTMIRGIGRGKFQVERYHLHVLRSPRECQNALQYVFNNELKHTGKFCNAYTGTAFIPRSFLLTSSRSYPSRS